MHLVPALRNQARDVEAPVVGGGAGSHEPAGTGRTFGLAGCLADAVDGMAVERSQPSRSIGWTTDRWTNRSDGQHGPGSGGRCLRNPSPGCVPLLDWSRLLPGTALWALALYLPLSVPLRRLRRPWRRARQRKVCARSPCCSAAWPLALAVGALTRWPLSVLAWSQLGRQPRTIGCALAGAFLGAWSSAARTIESGCNGGQSSPGQAGMIAGGFGSVAGVAGCWAIQTPLLARWLCRRATRNEGRATRARCSNCQRQAQPEAADQHRLIQRVAAAAVGGAGDQASAGFSGQATGPEARPPGAGRLAAASSRPNRQQGSSPTSARGQATPIPAITRPGWPPGRLRRIEARPGRGPPHSPGGVAQA